MIEIKCPATYQPLESDLSPKIFMGGSISNCPQWQTAMLQMLSKTNLTLFNPRRNDFDVTIADMSRQQIIWEFKHMQIADAIMFWFPEETLCPITLFELGAILNQNKHVFIGVHPNYKRRFDLEIQIPLYRKNITIHSSLNDLAMNISIWNNVPNH